MEKIKHNYNWKVISDVQDFYQENLNQKLTNDEVRELEPILVLQTYLEWNGIIGYTSDILNILKS